MVPGGHTQDGDLATAGSVEVRVGAELSQMFVLRSLAAALALRQDFDLDEVEDVKLAVDELCSALVQRASDGEQLTCRFDVAPHSVGVEASVRSDTDRPIARDTFGWRVLVALTDELASWTAPGDDRVYIRMTKTRS
ncbi:MAG TPA: anti-sigma factor [Pseudonocardiaceae bacterium]|nr:anti-sigma factor [Pseudonocardiaceae bacterium]